VDEIVTLLSGKYESQDITADVRELLAELAAKGLVTYDA
jgi:Coenzyme PQQ synthesis protein D (PqqD)